MATGLDTDGWLATGRTEADIREAIWKAATFKAKPWFKRTDMGELLAAHVIAALPQIPSSDISVKLTALEDWAYAG